MDITLRRIVSVASLLLACAVASASPTTQPAVVDPLVQLATTVSGKAADRSVVLAFRPDATSSIESPLAVAAIRTAVLHALTAARENITTSDSADALLRDSASSGPLTMAAAVPVLVAAKTDLVLCGVISRSGDVHRIAFTLFDAHAATAHLSVVMKAKDISVTGDEVEQAAASISSDVGAAVAKCMDPLQAAGVKTLLLTVRPETSGNAGTAGFEMALYDSISHALHENSIAVQSLSEQISVVTPASVANLKDAPADSAVAVVTYTRRPGGVVVKLSIVSAKAKLATATAGIDSWDAAVFPQLPVLNSRVLAYSDAQQGKKVGNGECWTLAAEALKNANAKRANGYTFGRKLAAGEAILPGDIFQFTSAKFEGKSGNRTWWVTLGTPHHTAVVRQVLGPQKYEILEQNPGPVKVATIDFKDLKSGAWEAWRPEAK